MTVVLWMMMPMVVSQHMRAGFTINGYFSGLIEGYWFPLAFEIFQEKVERG